MDITSLYYFTELAKDLHMTRTAERLFISQQTLSNHVQRLESYYGTPLFERKPSLHLTSAGEFVLGFAQLVVREDSNLKSVLFDVANQEHGLLRFSAGTSRTDILLRNILPAFSSKYPQVQIRATSAVSSQSEQLVISGDTDLAVVLASTPDNRLTAVSLFKEPVYLCVTESLLRKYYGAETDALKQKAFINGAHLRDFARLPFATMQNRMGDILRNLFARQDIVPNIQMASTHTSTYAPLCRKGIAACFLPHMMLDDFGAVDENLNVFAVYDDERPITTELVLVRRRDFYMAHYHKYFIQLLTDYFDAQSKKTLVHIVGGAGQSTPQK